MFWRQSFTIEHLFSSLVKILRRRYITSEDSSLIIPNICFSDKFSLPNWCTVMCHLVTCHLVIFPGNSTDDGFSPACAYWLSAIFPAIVYMYVYTYSCTYIQTLYLYTYKGISCTYIRTHLHTVMLKWCIHPSIASIEGLQDTFS